MNQAEWIAFQERFSKAFAEMPQKERLRMWAFLGDALWEDATATQCTAALAYIADKAAERIRAVNKENFNKPTQQN